MPLPEPARRSLLTRFNRAGNAARQFHAERLTHIQVVRCRAQRRHNSQAPEVKERNACGIGRSTGDGGCIKAAFRRCESSGPIVDRRLL